MNASRDVHLARQIAAQIDGRCKYRRDWWTTHESRLHAASTPTEAEAATTGPIRLCRTCLGYDLCEQWAQFDAYTGIAAGSVYINGRRHKPTTILLTVTPPTPANHNPSAH